jgi:hypothetical protein
MFRRELYRAMGRVLEAMDADALARTSFRFGGGTCLALGHGEYRISRDLDFVCSDAGGYADLRLAVRERGSADTQSSASPCGSGRTTRSFLHRGAKA